MGSSAVFVQPGSGQVMQVVGDAIVSKAGPAVTGGGWELFEVSGPEHSGPPLHAHPWSEAYDVLDGRLDVQAGDERCALGAGGFVHIPASTPHAYRVATPAARFLVMTSGDRAGAFFADLDREVGGAVDLEKIVAVAVRNGLSLEGPPLS